MKFAWIQSVSCLHYMMTYKVSLSLGPNKLCEDDNSGSWTLIIINKKKDKLFMKVSYQQTSSLPHYVFFCVSAGTALHE